MAAFLQASASHSNFQSGTILEVKFNHAHCIYDLFLCAGIAPLSLPHLAIF